MFEGMIRSTFAAVPSRGRVLAAKSAVVVGLLFVVGTVTALVGYVGGNYFLDREGIGLALEGDVLRAMYGSGLYLAGIGLFTVAVGFLLRHTAGTISTPDCAATSFRWATCRKYFSPISGSRENLESAIRA